MSNLHEKRSTKVNFAREDPQMSCRDSVPLPSGTNAQWLIHVSARGSILRCCTWYLCATFGESCVALGCISSCTKGGLSMLHLWVLMLQIRTFHAAFGDFLCCKWGHITLSFAWGPLRYVHPRFRSVNPYTRIFLKVKIICTCNGVLFPDSNHQSGIQTRVIMIACRYLQ